MIFNVSEGNSKGELSHTLVDLFHRLLIPQSKCHLKHPQPPIDAKGFAGDLITFTIGTSAAVNGVPKPPKVD